MPVFLNNQAISKLNQRVLISDLDAICIAGGSDLLIRLGLSILYFETENRSPTDIPESIGTFCVGNRRSVCLIGKHCFSVCFCIAPLVVFNLYYFWLHYCGWFKTKIDSHNVGIKNFPTILQTIQFPSSLLLIFPYRHERHPLFLENACLSYDPLSLPYRPQKSRGTF